MSVSGFVLKAKSCEVFFSIIYSEYHSICPGGIVICDQVIIRLSLLFKLDITSQW